MARRKREAQPLRRSARITSTPKLPPKPPSICEPCRRGPFAAQLGLFHPGGYSYFVRRSHIEQRASSGCRWCKLLLSELILPYELNGAKLERRLEISLSSKKQRFSTLIDAQLLEVELASEVGIFLHKILSTSSVDPAAPYIAARDPITDVGSARTLSLAKALIDECVHGHERCKQISPSSDVRLPTRLVDCTDPAFPRLVSTEGQGGIYLALSYVWGEAQPHKTTDANKSVYSAGIAASLLPHTIRDAIYVTHTLGFRYLWVDSLCIIQDSDEDKLHEIGRMHLIYRHAYLTIIAASAERASDGFLQDRPAPPHTIALSFICPPHPPIPGDKISRGKQPVAGGEVRLSDSNKFIRSDREEPVDRRGWCLQELLMSSRALIFTSTTLRFRCQDTTLNVGNSLCGVRDAHDVRLPDIVLHPAPLPLQPGSKERHHAHARWTRVVEEYSRRTLGEASDRLVACGALAEAFHRVLGCDYLAGLWRDTLFEDLLWDNWTQDSGHVKDRPAEYRAPSWSWAAVDGKISSVLSHHSNLGVVCAQVVRCDVTLKDRELPFGEVTGGSLVLRAKLIPCKVRKADNRWGAEILLPRLSCGQYSGGLRRRHVSEDSTVLVEDDNLGVLAAECFVDYLPDLLIERDSDWLLPFWWGMDAGNRWPEVGGLIVALANPDSGSETENRRVYRRIGTFLSMHYGCDRLRASYTRAEEEVEIV